ncbi:MAG: hypothetical protein HYZ34_13125, partial [Ignavibacteriae bacterium]|nr:hypothetical protein [Ignavibacteriota bacterium]
LDSSTTYYWKIVVKDNHSYSTSGVVWSFTTKLQPPILSFPTNGATNISNPPTLTWNASNGATSYALQISTDSLFSSSIYQSGLINTSQQIGGLRYSTKYYWHVQAINSNDMSNWSSKWIFTTTSTVTYAGKTYNTVQIGTQCWLKENLDVGTMVDSLQNQTNNSTIEKYCYNNDPANCNTYGGFYQWNEAMQYSSASAQGICPNGWHIPTKAEFQTLQTQVGNDGNALKEVGQGTGGGAGTNTSGFSALLSGYRHNGRFNHLGLVTLFWSSTQYYTTGAHTLSLTDDVSSIRFFYYDKEDYGFSIRCLKD